MSPPRPSAKLHPSDRSSAMKAGRCHVKESKGRAVANRELPLSGSRPQGLKFKAWLTELRRPGGLSAQGRVRSCDWRSEFRVAARSVRVLFAELQPDSERSPSRRSLGPAEFQLNRESELYLLSGAAALAVVALESDQIPFHRAPAAPSRSRSSRYSTPNRAWHRQLQVGAAAIPLQPSTARRSRA